MGRFPTLRIVVLSDECSYTMGTYRGKIPFCNVLRGLRLENADPMRLENAALVAGRSEVGNIGNIIS